jgi:SAM-dependent methyltransferase
MSAAKSPYYGLVGTPSNLESLYRARYSKRWIDKVYQALLPPLPLVADPAELDVRAPLGKHNLYIGGAGCAVEGYVNVDLYPMAGVDVVADAAHLPFREDLFTRVECDAVLEHVIDPEPVMREIERTLEPGGYVHIVTPFCHPFHEYPKDFRRFTIDGLRQLGRNLEFVKGGWRTGPTATMLVFGLEYVKIVLPWKPARVITHGVLGWLLFPLRYIDVILRRSPRFGQIGNHCYVWLRKPGP